MNYNFRDGIRRITSGARDEAIRLGHNYIGTEHLLIALAGEPSGRASQMLSNAGIAAADIIDSCHKLAQGPQGPIATGELPYSQKAKATFQETMRFVRDLDLDYIDTEHLLVGLTLTDGVAAAVLRELGLTPEAARAALAALDSA